MCQWHRNIQRMIDEIDACIRREDDEASTLSRLVRRGLGTYLRDRQKMEQTLRNRNHTPIKYHTT